MRIWTDFEIFEILDIMNLHPRSNQIIKNIFPNSKIIEIKYFSEGLASKNFLVCLENSKQKLVVKEFKLKHLQDIEKDIKIQKYLSDLGFVQPKIIAIEKDLEPGILIMEYIEGKVGTDSFMQASDSDQSIIMKQAGKNLKRIHDIRPIPEFWQNKKIEIKNFEDWSKWTKERIDKYLAFGLKNFEKDLFEKIQSRLKGLEEQLGDERREIVPLHWDYHLGNIIYGSYFGIISTIDFSSAMPGDLYADIGQMLYWQLIKSETRNHFDDFLFGYKESYSKGEIALIENYYLLHLLAVTRSTWDKVELTWLKEMHLKMLKEIGNGIIKN
jgi:aminoglycoside phosphotransferase (APT) family kinase protein